MCRPFRRYSFGLAERLGYSLKRLYSELDSTEIIEWMAYDKTTDTEWVKAYKKNLEIEKSKEMTAGERVEAFKKLFGVPAKDGKKDGNNRKLNSGDRH